MSRGPGGHYPRAWLCNGAEEGLPCPPPAADIDHIVPLNTLVEREIRAQLQAPREAARLIAFDDDAAARP